MKNLKEFVRMSIGCLLLAAGVYFFKIPNGFVTGGVSGIGIILGKLTRLTPGEWVWILNILILIAGFLILGKATGIRTIYCSMLYSALIFLFERVIPLHAPITALPLLDLIYAILLTGIGSALIFTQEASSGGTDVVALILKKYTKINVGKALMVTDFAVAASSLWLFGVQIGLLSLLGLFAKAFLVDTVIESIRSCKYFCIITQKRELISEYIIKTLHHGVTVSEVTGEYTGEKKYMLHTVCKRIEAIRLKAEIKEADPSAFVIVSTSNEIIGRGFREV